MNIAQHLSCHRRLCRDAQLNNLQSSIFQRHKLDETEIGEFGLDERENRPGRTDRYIDTELLEDLSVLRVIHAGNSATNLEALLRNLANHEVILVFTGDGDNDISTAGS